MFSQAFRIQLIRVSFDIQRSRKSNRASSTVRTLTLAKPRTNRINNRQYRTGYVTERENHPWSFQDPECLPPSSTRARKARGPAVRNQLSGKVEIIVELKRRGRSTQIGISVVRISPVRLAGWPREHARNVCPPTHSSTCLLICLPAYLSTGLPWSLE